MSKNRSENTYVKINTIFKRDNNNVIMPYDSFAVPELEWLRNCKFDATEKIDGTNIRIEVTRENIESELGDITAIKWNVAYKGKSDNAQVPKMLMKHLQDTYPAEKVLNALGLWEIMEANATFTKDKGWSIPSNKCLGAFEFDFSRIPSRYTLYGEGYGAGIQSGGYYQKEQKFIGFDVKVDNTYLLRDNMLDIFNKLGCPTVPYIGSFTVYEAIEYVKNGFNSTIAEDTHLAEGLVLKTPNELMSRRGERIIFKIKTCDFNKYFAKYNTFDKVEQTSNSHINY